VESLPTSLASTIEMLTRSRTPMCTDADQPGPSFLTHTKSSVSYKQCAVVGVTRPRSSRLFSVGKHADARCLIMSNLSLKINVAARVASRKARVLLCRDISPANI
jgi:hypothetical protein